MKEKKNLIIILILLVGVVGITIAYFSNTTSIDNLFSTKKYGSTITEEFISPDSWLPGDETDKSIVATNTGEVDQAVRISYTEKWVSASNSQLNGWIHEDGSKSSHETEEELSNDERVAIINFDNNDDWTYNNGYYYYNYRLQPNESTSSLIKSVTFNPKTKLDDTCTTTISDGKKTITCNSSGSDYDNAKYTLTFNIETVQYNKYKEAWGVDIALAENRQLYCDAFEVGEVVTYNNQDFYVLKDSSTEDDYLTLFKKDPLTAEEVNAYSTDYISQDGEYPYFESDTCNENIQTGCSTNYDTSSVKKIIDGWSSSFGDDLVEIDGYKTRLISENDIIIRKQINVSSISYELVTDTIEPLLENDNNYWISYTFDDSNVDILGYKETWNGYFNEYRVYEKLYIRPIINVKKSSIINACYLKKSEIVCTNGELVSYDGEDYFVLENSGTDEKYVSLLKIEPLTAEEVNAVSVDYISQNGEYPFCLEGNNCLKNVKGSGAQILNFSKSDIKKLVDKWSYKYINDLVGKDKYKSRLLTIDEFNNNDDLKLSEKYWSMSTYRYTTHTTISGAYSLSTNIFQEDNVNNKYLVRPVINLHKNAIESGCHVEDNNNESQSEPEQQVEACDINNYNHVSYSIGDTIYYNNDDYYVIENSSADQNYVTLLKVDPLTYNELRKYNNGYDIHNSYGIGLINFYKSDTCTATNNDSGCTTNYNDSFVKIIVDNWSNSIESNLVEINGYKARLLNLDELRDNFGYEYVPKDSWSVYVSSDETPNWLKNNSYSSWTMTPYEYDDYIYVIADDYLNGERGFVADYSAIRPVINLKKCAISN